MNKTLSWHRSVPMPQRKLFGAPAPDLLTLVIAAEIKRKAEEQRAWDSQREALHDTAPMPWRRPEIAPADPDDSN